MVNRAGDDVARRQGTVRVREWQPVLRHDLPQPITPGEIVPVEVEILPSSTLLVPQIPDRSAGAS